jgi:nitrogen fixation NifU-like protein
MEAEELYTEIIIDLHRNPKNFGELDAPDLTLSGGSTVCGDQVIFHLRLEEGRITAIRFHGSGCVISRASESLLTELVLGRTVEEVLNLSADDVLQELGIALQLRRKCALLGLHVLREGLSKWREGGMTERMIRGITLS